MTYIVSIIPTSGEKITYLCHGENDQEALIYAGKVVERNANASDPDARVLVELDGKAIGPEVTVADMTRKVV